MGARRRATNRHSGRGNASARGGKPWWKANRHAHRPDQRWDWQREAPQRPPRRRARPLPARVLRIGLPFDCDRALVPPDTVWREIERSQRFPRHLFIFVGSGVVGGGDPTLPRSETPCCLSFACDGGGLGPSSAWEVVVHRRASRVSYAAWNDGALGLPDTRRVCQRAKPRDIALREAVVAEAQ